MSQAKLIHVSKLSPVILIAAIAACIKIPDPKQISAQLDYSALEDAYMDDSLDAICEDTPDDNGQEDDHVSKVTSGKHLDDMISRKFPVLDSDQSGTLSYEEFAKYDEKVTSSRNLSEDQKSLRRSRLKSHFERFAGDDKVMSPDEFKTFLTSVKGKVSSHRRKKQGSDDSKRVNQPDTGRRGGDDSGSDKPETERGEKDRNRGHL